MSASGINPGWQRDYFTRHRICVCDPTSGDTCRHCDPDDGTNRAAITAAVAAVTQREQRSATPERRAS